MSIIQVDRKDGLPGMVYSAHLLPAPDSLQKPAREQGRKAQLEGHALADAVVSAPDYAFLEPNIPSHLDTDF
ncbi:MAG: hypothetical protein ABIV48_11670, partial [Pyrinomonadaceae bacterium]